MRLSFIVPTKVERTAVQNAASIASAQRMAERNRDSGASDSEDYE